MGSIEIKKKKHKINMGNARRESQLFFCSVKVTQSDCAFGPTLAASIKLMCNSTHIPKSSQNSALFFESGEMAVTFPQPRLQAVGLAIQA